MTATLADRILRVLRTASRPLDDDELAAHIGVIRQVVNQACRRMEIQGLLRRYIGANNKIVNELAEDRAAAGPTPAPTGPPAPPPRPSASCSAKTQ